MNEIEVRKGGGRGGEETEGRGEEKGRRGEGERRRGEGRETKRRKGNEEERKRRRGGEGKGKEGEERGEKGREDREGVEVEAIIVLMCSSIQLPTCSSLIVDCLLSNFHCFIFKFFSSQ